VIPRFQVAATEEEEVLAGIAEVLRSRQRGHGPGVERAVGERLGNPNGNLCVDSFQSLKMLSCGRGGVAALPTEEQRACARRRRWLGIDRGSADRVAGDYDVPEWGCYRVTMTEINATIGRRTWASSTTCSRATEPTLPTSTRSSPACRAWS
jgi:DegT/DnrJ/EryC1/StrS aminotransferase family